ncbi:hypothetical protein ILUMI_03705 [Ignelater luminosus]|uniref:DDE Tnp4 domain-containing protein n=1 Tax=Ignelater luminosus TaxID=2038154 RepID=A0A8K0DAA2_IGNLU|nr:hypothetical protein ILUMI_03705 [Ignelater luminosus]
MVEYFIKVLSKALSHNTIHFPNASALPGQENFTQYVLVADDAFPLSEYLMKPYPKRGLITDVEFLITARGTIEHAFGILENRFRIREDYIESLFEDNREVKKIEEQKERTGPD